MEKEIVRQEDKHEQYEIISENDAAYFSSYENLEVHRLMLKDAPRTEAYRQAILNNRRHFEGKCVMDVGAGTGILSLFCAQAGASRVYAVEASQLADITRRVVEKNGFSDVIEVIQGKAEDIDLPADTKVDIIVSEWMGFYLLHESMLDSVVAARDKHLKPDGVMLPSKATLYAAACRLSDFYSEQVDFWKSVYGFDLSPVGDQLLQSKSSKPEVISVNADDLLSKPARLLEIDLAWVGLEEIQSVESRHFASITSLDPTAYQGVCLWFDCEFSFDENPPVKLSTSPHSPATHWKQTVIVLPSSIQVEEGDLIGWELKLTQSASNHRHYVIELALLDPENDEHPVPCTCGSARCAIIAAYLAREDAELTESGAEMIDIS